MFVNVEVYPYQTNVNKYHKPLYRKCYWCNADAMVIVSRTSTLTGITYTDPACDFHASKWGPPEDGSGTGNR
jgi:hypothetical protein